MKKNPLVGLIALAMAAPTIANAIDGTVTFTGKVTSNTCTIAVNGGTANATVALPTVRAGQLAASGDVAGATYFTIALSSCTLSAAASGDTPAVVGVTSARTFFEAGPTVSTTTKNLLNSTAAGSAANVEVQLLNQSGTAILVGDTGQRSAAATTVTDGAATMTYAARYRATGVSTAGTVNTSVTYSIDYL